MDAAIHEVRKTEMGKSITLGGVYAEYTLPDGKKLLIKRMGMNKEIRFIELYKKFVAALKEEQGTIVEMLNQYMSGGTSVKFGVTEGLELLGQVFDELPKLQTFAIEGVQIIAQSCGTAASTEWIKDNLSTMDCFEILGSQAEVQGLMSSFRGLIATLGSLGQGKE